MRVAIFFATREGHTRRIAARIAADLETRGALVDVYNVRTAGPIDWSCYSSACVAASVHGGTHERRDGRVRRETPRRARTAVGGVRSVSLSEAGAEDEHRPDEHRRQSAADVQRMIDVFIKTTGWSLRAPSPPPAHSIHQVQPPDQVRHEADCAQNGGAHRYVTRLRLHQLAAVDRFAAEIGGSPISTSWVWFDRAASPRETRRGRDTPPRA